MPSFRHLQYSHSRYVRRLLFQDLLLIEFNASFSMNCSRNSIQQRSFSCAICTYKCNDFMITDFNADSMQCFNCSIFGNQLINLKHSNPPCRDTLQ